MFILFLCMAHGIGVQKYIYICIRLSIITLVIIITYIQSKPNIKNNNYL